MTEIKEGYVSEEQGVEKPSPCYEFLDFLDEKDIPLADHIREVADGSSISRRYGNEFAQASGKILRRVSTHEPGNILRLNAFGLNYTEIENDVMDYIKNQDDDLSPAEVDRLIELEMEELPRDPKGFYDQMDSLETHEEFEYQGTQLLVSLLKDAVQPKEAGKQARELPHKATYQFAVCKDSEFYMAAAIEPKFQEENGASTLVYYDEDGPLLIQKTGRYKINHNPDYGEKGLSNSTAITLRPIVVKGIELPPGTLVGPAMSEKAERLVTSPHSNALPASELEGISPLRLTIYNLPEEEQKSAFGEHFEDFKEAFQGWTYKGKDLPTIETFQEYAQKVVERQTDKNKSLFPIIFPVI